MFQVVEQTHEECVKMYMRCTKRKLAEMLANRDVLEGAYKFKPHPMKRVDAMPLDDWRSGHIYQSNT